jgi:hypothetical protein
MADPRTRPGDDPDLTRRDFLTKRLPGRVAALLGGDATVVSAAPAADAAASDPAGSFSPRELIRMSRDDVRAALARIRTQRRGC